MAVANTGDARKAFAALKQGERVCITHGVRVGKKRWTNATTGVVLRTERRRSGLHVDRADDDRVYADTILLRREDGEVTTVTLDEFTTLEILPGKA